MKNEIEKILAEYTDGKETLQEATTKVLRLFSVSVSVDFAKWIGEKQCKDLWFRYNNKNGKWHIHMKGHLTTDELYEVWKATEH